MTTSRLAKSSTGIFTSKISAWDWARMAKEKGLLKHAKAWEEAARNGWDDVHYRPDA